MNKWIWFLISNQIGTAATGCQRRRQQRSNSQRVFFAWSFFISAFFIFISFTFFFVIYRDLLFVKHIFPELCFLQLTQKLVFIYFLIGPPLTQYSFRPQYLPIRNVLPSDTTLLLISQDIEEKPGIVFFGRYHKLLTPN